MHFIWFPYKSQVQRAPTSCQPGLPSAIYDTSTQYCSALRTFGFLSPAQFFPATVPPAHLKDPGENDTTHLVPLPDCMELVSLQAGNISTDLT